jgi:hypothetical protein
MTHQTDRQARDAWRSLLIATLLLTILLVAKPHAFGQEASSLLSPDPNFPDGISPSHVYARIDLLDRSVDKIVEAMRFRVLPEDFPQEIESDLQPMHVYQAVLTCTWRLQELDDKVGVRIIPNISAQPRRYHPRDVFFIVDLILDNVRSIGQKLNVADMPTDETPVTEKVPTDVFNRAVQIFIKFNALCGHSDVTPDEVFAQLVRATEDVKSILRQGDPACRYYTDAAAVYGEKSPGDVFIRCTEIRKLINEKRQEAGLDAIPVPSARSRLTIRPRDVFFQTQIIIAELNLLKKPHHTVSSTPLAIPVTDKTPTDVFVQAAKLEYLLKQVNSN